MTEGSPWYVYYAELKGIKLIKDNTQSFSGGQGSGVF